MPAQVVGEVRGCSPCAGCWMRMQEVPGHMGTWGGGQCDSCQGCFTLYSAPTSRHC